MTTQTKAFMGRALVKCDNKNEIYGIELVESDNSDFKTPRQLQGVTCKSKDELVALAKSINVPGHELPNKDDTARLTLDEIRIEESKLLTLGFLRIKKLDDRASGQAPSHSC